MIQFFHRKHLFDEKRHAIHMDFTSERGGLAVEHATNSRNRCKKFMRRARQRSIAQEVLETN